PLSELCALPEQVSDRPAHDGVPCGRSCDSLEAEAEVEGVRRRHNGAFLEPACGEALEVVRVRGAAGRWPGGCPPVHDVPVVLERGRSGPCRDGDVVYEVAETLGRPVADVGDRDLDLL